MKLRSKEPKLTKTPHPSEVEGNGHFTSDGGLDIYKLLWGLQGRMSRVEAGWAFNSLLLAAILTKLMEVW